MLDYIGHNRYNAGRRKQRGKRRDNHEVPIGGGGKPRCVEKKGNGMKKLMLMAAMFALMVVALAPAAYAKIVTGTNEDDFLRGTDSADEINGLRGDDTLVGR